MLNQNNPANTWRTELLWFGMLAVLVGAIGYLSDLIFPRPPAVYADLYPAYDHMAVGSTSPPRPLTPINIPKDNDRPHWSTTITGPSGDLALTGAEEPDCRAFFDSSLWWSGGIEEVGLEF